MPKKIVPEKKLPEPVAVPEKPEPLPEKGKSQH